jgi:hypothetical protein
VPGLDGCFAGGDREGDREQRHDANHTASSNVVATPATPNPIMTYECRQDPLELLALDDRAAPVSDRDRRCPRRKQRREADGR